MLKKGINFRNLLFGALLFGLILLAEIAVGFLSEATGVQLPTNVDKVMFGMPLYFLVFSFLIAPIDEEILFRGFLVPRLGIVPSALLFALAHVTYLSWSRILRGVRIRPACGLLLQEVQVALHQRYSPTCWSTS